MVFTNKIAQGVQQLLMRIKEQNRQRGESCTICLERTANCSLDGCSHEFCIRCIKKWSRRNNTCPLCRQTYQQLKYNHKVINVIVGRALNRRHRNHFQTLQEQHPIPMVPMLRFPSMPTPQLPQNPIFYLPFTYVPVQYSFGINLAQGFPGFFFSAAL